MKINFQLPAVHPCHLPNTKNQISWFRLPDSITSSTLQRAHFFARSCSSSVAKLHSGSGLNTNLVAVVVIFITPPWFFTCVSSTLLESFQIKKIYNCIIGQASYMQYILQNIFQQKMLELPIVAGDWRTEKILKHNNI